MKWICLILLIIFGAALILNILNIVCKKCKWFCRVMEMHYEPTAQVFHRLNNETKLTVRGICPRCGEKVKKSFATHSTWVIDTHHYIDIAHPCFWVNSKGEHPDPLTAITPKDIEKGTWKTNPLFQKRVDNE